MNTFEIIIIAIGLAMDAFAVSLSVAASRGNMSVRPTFRLSFHFGLFQFMMPIIGWFIGNSIASLLIFNQWIAFILLVFIGTRMIISGLKGEEQKNIKDATKGLSLIMLSLATSLDALAIGFSLALLSINIWYPSVIIGIITAIFSLVAIYLGQKLNETLGDKMEIIGGIILIAIGIKIVLF